MGEIDYGEIQQVLDDLLGQNVDFRIWPSREHPETVPFLFRICLRWRKDFFSGN